MFSEHFVEKVSAGDPVAITALAGLSEESALLCSCAPFPCHGETIRNLRGRLGGVRQRSVFHDDGTLPRDNEVFVFGSNLAGRHGAGAALMARERYGAVLGEGCGYSGKSPAHSYAIPTKDARLAPLHVDEIKRYIERFEAFVKSRPDLRFFVTRVGCGLAGHKDQDIAPLFINLPAARCSFPSQWRNYLSPASMTYAGIGARKTPHAILIKMKRIAERLEERGYTLRSGGADGADIAFASGCSRKEIFLPWPGFNDIDSPWAEPTNEAMEVAAAVHPEFNNLTWTVKKLMARNSHQILGSDLRKPVDFVVCWTPDGAETEKECSCNTGVTGQAIALADRWGIPVFNLARENAMHRLGKLILEMHGK